MTTLGWVLIVAALLCGANYGRWRGAQRDRFWIRDLARRDHAVEKLGGEAWVCFEDGAWQGAYDSERDALRDRDQLREGL